MKGTLFWLLIIVVLGGCTAIRTNTTDRVVTEIDIGPPYINVTTVNGKRKCTSTGAGKLILKGKPGQCMIVDADGIWRKVGGGCVPK